jgi:sarcosine oxidase subunit gamma
MPEAAGEVKVIRDRLLLKTGPEQFWIIAGDGQDLIPALQSAITPATGSLTSLSHSRTCIVIEGPHVRDVLAMGVALDFHPDAFRPNCFALTGLHQTPILIHRSGESRYELYAMRTFAIWVWERLTDAALPFGYDVCIEPGFSPDTHR